MLKYRNQLYSLGVVNGAPALIKANVGDRNRKLVKFL